MRRIRVSSGKYSLVDARFYSVLKAMGKWSDSRGYAIKQAPRKRGKPRQTLRMHRVVWKLAGRPTCKELDHKDGNTLNNRLSNLRPATKAQNAANRLRLPGYKTSKYRGVARTPWGWQAKIVVDGRSRSLGYFSSERRAAREYDRTAKQAWGTYARTNFK